MQPVVNKNILLFVISMFEEAFRISQRGKNTQVQLVCVQFNCFLVISIFFTKNVYKVFIKVLFFPNARNQIFSVYDSFSNQWIDDLSIFY